VSVEFLFLFVDRGDILPISVRFCDSSAVDKCRDLLISLSGYTRRQEINKPDRQQNRSIAFAAYGKQIYGLKHSAVSLGTTFVMLHIYSAIAYTIIYSLFFAAQCTRKNSGPRVVV